MVVQKFDQDHVLIQLEVEYRVDLNRPKIDSLRINSTGVDLEFDV